MENYKLVFTYTKEVRSHSGYCSDPGEDQEDTSTFTREYPVNDVFVYKYVNEDGEVDVTGYYKNPDFQPYRIDEGGHGWCGCGTQIYVNSAKLVKKKRVKSKYFTSRLTEARTVAGINFASLWDYIVYLESKKK